MVELSPPFHCATGIGADAAQFLGAEQTPQWLKQSTIAKYPTPEPILFSCFVGVLSVREACHPTRITRIDDQLVEYCLNVI